MSPRRQATVIVAGGVALLAVIAALVLVGPATDVRPGRSTDPVKRRPPGPSLLLAEPLRSAVGRLRERHGDGRLVSLRLDARTLQATVADGDRLRAVTLRSNKLDRANSVPATGGRPVGPRVSSLAVDTLPRIVARVSARSGQPRDRIQAILLELAGSSGSWAIQLATGERWTAAFDGSGVRRADAGGVVDVDALRRCFERATTPQEQAACTP